jgi:hypothetical protein
MSEKRKEPIFIIGCPRSGTTILGEFFDDPSRFNYFREIDIWEKQPNKFLNNIFLRIIDGLTPLTRRSLKLSIFLKIIRQILVDILGSLHLLITGYNSRGDHRLDENDVTADKSKLARSYLTDDRQLVVKATLNSLKIPFIKKIFPDAKFIHIVRDGRDVACSMMNAPSGYFWSYIRPPGWKNIKKKFRGIYRCAWQWKATLYIIYEDKKKISEKDWIDIHYEEFVQHPQKSVKEIFDKFDLEFTQYQLELCQKVANRVNRKSMAKNDKTTVLDHPFRIGRYKKELTEQEIQAIEKTLDIKNWNPSSTDLA